MQLYREWRILCDDWENGGGVSGGFLYCNLTAAAAVGSAVAVVLGALQCWCRTPRAWPAAVHVQLALSYGTYYSRGSSLRVSRPPSIGRGPYARCTSRRRRTRGILATLLSARAPVTDGITARKRDHRLAAAAIVHVWCPPTRAR
uniref:Uncharacterized protein n=1 Tax=Schizaphis graminum TaxID=13262 RepID=A0A2S2NI74_SCHGA